MAAEPIAIVGMSCRLPSGIGDPSALWDLCRDGRSVAAPYGERRSALVGGAGWAPPGAYLDAADVAGFDAEFFALAASEAAAIDPQQRLLLTVTWEALERAGLLASGRLSAIRTGVFIGLMSADYGQLPGAQAIGVDLGLAAGRISHLLALRGPSLTVSAACASGLAAVHLGCLSLRAGDSDVVVAGAANIILTPDRGRALARLGALSPDGRCRSFDAEAAGFGLGEGCAVVVLRRLRDALAAGDRIDAVVRGSALGHNGAGGGLVLPSGPAQQEVIRAAHADAGVEASQISYVEAHGSATPLGDAIEAGALAAVFAPRVAAPPLPIGSVKANLGHSEAAAGIVSLQKVVMALGARELPPLAGLTRPHPNLPLDGGVLALPSRPEPWPRIGGARLAGVSAFSLTGTNAHLVVGEAPAAPPATVPARRPQLLLVSARDRAACDALASSYVEALERLPLPVACSTAARHRPRHAHRMALVAESRAGMAAALALGRSRVATPQAPVFVFCGLGTQWPGMGAELIRDEPAFGAVLEDCDAAARALGAPSILAAIREARDVGVDVALPALTALQLGLAALWRAWGVAPGAVVGASSGEIAAACVAGILTPAEAMAVAARLGSRLAQLPRDGAMVAVGLSVEELLPWVRDGSEVYVGAINSPRTTTLTGDRDAIAAVLDVLRADGVTCFALDVERAYHGPAIDQACAGLASELDGLAPQPALVPFVSSVTGGADDGAALGAQHWPHVARRPIEFSRAIQTLLAAGHTTFLELGPQPALGLALQECMTAAGCTGAIVASMRRGPSARRTLLAAAGELYELGHDVEPYREGQASAGLPTYRWRLVRHWVAPESPSQPVALARASAELRAQLEATIAAELAGVLGVAADDLDRGCGLFDLGATSVEAVALTAALEARLGVPLPRTVTFDHPTIERLADHLATTLDRSEALVPVHAESAGEGS